MIIKWTDEINSFDKHKCIHKEKQIGCYLIDQAEDNLFVSLYDFIFFYFFIFNDMDERRRYTRRCIP